MSYVSPKEAKHIYGVTPFTLRRWADAGKIEFIVTKGGHYRYHSQKIDKRKKKYIYGRVSSAKQSIDLKRQIWSLKRTRKKGYIIVTDIGSGINFKRPGLRTILEQVVSGNVEEVVVAYKDRLARFGYDLLEWIFTKFGTEIVVQNAEPETDKSHDLTEDLMSVITVFTARYYGQRKYGKEDKKNKILPKQKDEDIIA